MQYVLYNYSCIYLLYTYVYNKYIIKYTLCDPLWENVPYRNCVQIAKKTATLHVQ